MASNARRFQSDDEMRAYYSARAGRTLSDQEVVNLYVADSTPAYFESSRSGPRWGRVALGVTVALVALAISIGSVEQASSAGGTYIVFWGAVIWGGWIAIKGLAGE